MTPAARMAAVARLRRRRPRNRFVRGSVAVLALLAAASWAGGGFRPAGWLTPHRLDNAARFLGELRPWPLQGTAWDWSNAAVWARGLWQGGGAAALGTTLAVSLVAIVMAGAAAAWLAPAAARNLATPRPFAAGGRRPGRLERVAWRSLVGATRLLLIFLRAVPEYVWAFLLLAVLGPSAWPMVLALALHNAGILGRLGAEVVENTAPAAPGALRALGAGRTQILLAAVVPLALPRWLLYLFYRWETCVREATVLGMLGMASLGFGIVQSRAANRYDEMVFYVLLAVVLVLAGDVVSTLSRRLLRRA